jgi:hypothetical protein
MGGFTQLMMHTTEIVGTSNQIHARLKRSEAASGMTGFARQAGQPFPKGAIQAFDTSRVEDRPRTLTHQQLLCLLHQAVSHPPGDLDHPFFLRSLDHRANVQLGPDLQTGSPNSPPLLDLLPECWADTARISTPPVGQDEQGTQTGRTSTNLLHQGIGQMTIPRELDHPTQPQTRRNHHGQAHPGDHLASFHPNLIGLNMSQVELSLFNEGLMDLVAMDSCSIAPSSYGALIQSEGMHNRLNGASIGQERHYHDYQVYGFTQSLKHGSPTGAQRLVARLTTITLPFSIMDDDGARFSLASCGTHRIRAKCFRWVHWLWCTVLHKHILPGTLAFFNFLLLHRIVGSYPGQANKLE